LTLPGYRRERGYEAIRQQHVPVRAADERLAHPDVQVEIGYDRAQAMREASRCLDCGVTPVFDGSRCVLCGGCADVCPTKCLALVPLGAIALSEPVARVIEHALGPSIDVNDHSAILKDEERCIRCALCVMRCPVEAITMERVTLTTSWRTS
jgi:ferredoxin